jgi:hypothetical protein
MTYEIKYPIEKTYWIFWTDTISNFVYGWTEPKQITDTNQPNWWITIDEAEWVYKLETEFNTNPFPPEPITDNIIE